MNKKSIKWAALGVVVALIAGGAWWYTRPVTLTQLCPTVQIGKSAAVSGIFLTVDGQRTEDGALVPTRATFGLTGEDEAFGRLIQLLEDASFRRTLTLPLPWDQGARSHAYEVGDIAWRLYFHFDTVFIDEKGNGNSGVLLQLENYFGDLTFFVSAGNERWHLKADEALLKEVYELLAPNGVAAPF